MFVRQRTRAFIRELNFLSIAPKKRSIRSEVGWHGSWLGAYHYEIKITNYEYFNVMLWLQRLNSELPNLKLTRPQIIILKS